MSHELLLILLGVLLFGGILSGVPVSLVLLGAPFLVAALGTIIGVFDLAFVSAFPSRAFGLLTNPVFVAVPLFVLMGSLLEKANIAKRMMLMAGALFGERRGGMAYAVIVVGALLAASTGVIGATIFMLGLIALPAMLSANYSPRLSSGVICASGSLGQIIPPSILLILLADQVSAAYQSGRRAAGDFAPEPVSVGDLFAGALLPGLVLVGLYLLYTFAVSILRPETCPPIRYSGGKSGDKIDTGELVTALVLPLALILLVLGSILGGIATPTESAGLGAAGALVMVAMERQEMPIWRRSIIGAVLPAAFLLVLVRSFGGANASSFLMATGVLSLAVLLSGVALATWQELRLGALLDVARGTATMVSMLTLIVLGATMLSLVFRGLGGDEMVSDFLTNLPGGTMTALFAVMLVIFLLGFLIEYIEIIFIVVPVAGPPLMAAGVDPVWFAILISMNLQMSFLTPPFGYALFYFRSVAPASLTTRDVYASVIPFILLQLFALALVAALPELATWLPNVIFN
ncbi:TRAP transporter large permease [Chelativorans salis]|uniref:TRAP transporter large permease subunit n=1 Tax=Chelativorans salis TaxID=2978478 RepID=A0ABT2LVL5_9HYPH|nr:TRAP transporter large permease subunit [Chelativorans sp. EGI FJ00035]MCT7377907.1 TRAP transporter large permease subunit [Chelativorans sp. EGI FJ00035]